MGRIKPAWYYTRQANEAQARQTYYQNRTPPETPVTIKSRGAMTEAFYRSLIEIEGTDHVIYQVNVPNTTVNLLSLAEAGLLATLPSTSQALRLRGSGLHPTKIHWYRGSTEPARHRSAWGTSVAKYYDSTGGQSHFSTPFSRASGVFGPNDLSDAFNALFGESGTKRGLLGTANGRAYIEWERVTISATT